MYMTKPTELCIRLCHCQSSASWGDEDTIRSNCLVIAPAAPCKRHEMCFVSCLSLYRCAKNNLGMFMYFRLKYS